MNFFFNKFLKYFISFVEKKLPFFFIHTPFMSSLYYLLFSSKFRREQHSVLNGKVKYLKSSKFRKDNIYNLIINIHRIEKGLLMKNRKRIFALSYIKETTEIFISVWNQEKTLNDKQFIWFFDVLSEYFNTSGYHPLVDELKMKFKIFTSNYNRKKPYKLFVI